MAGADRLTLMERLWYGSGVVERAGRALLWPLAALYRAGSSVRNGLYDRGVLRVHEAALPALAVGNLAAGGTGKTPVAAWLASQLSDGGASPGIVMRGYGRDETLVHSTLNPGVPVIADADRVRGIARARDSGCDVVVLDDAFQHRRAARTADVVLVSADTWSEPLRPLPVGPWREPVSALSRAELVLITRKAAARVAAHALARRLAGETATGAAAVMRLRLFELARFDGGEVLPLNRLRGRRVYAVAGVGDPRSFLHQLRAEDARVELQTFPDHHRFTVAEAGAIARRARAHDFVVCTLKDAVKLRGVWPREAPLPWYVSLRCELEEGAEAVDAVLRRLLEARAQRTPIPPDPSGH